MSVDFYVAVPAASFPTAAAAVERCMADHAYPVRIKRFPVFDRRAVVTDRVLASVDGKDAYLAGRLAIGSDSSTDVAAMNKQLNAAGSSEMITADDVVMSFHVSTPAEMRATAYVISTLIVCFKGLGFEPQGKTSGRADFARSLIADSETLKGL